MASILGHKYVQVKKDDENCRWGILNAEGNLILEVSFSWAYRSDEAPNDDYYNAIYTALVHAPLTDRNRQDIFKRWPDLRYQEELELSPEDVPEVHSKEVESDHILEQPTGKRRIQ